MGMKLFTCALLCAAMLCFPAAKARENRAYASDDPAIRTVCLTFDDGPTDSTTPKVLDVLERENVPATFFVIGRQIGRRKDILRRIYGAGHASGVHTYSHEYKKIYSSPQKLLEDIALCRTAIRKVLPDWDSMLYRFPGGQAGLSEKLVSAVREKGYRICGWNASVEDAVSPFAKADDLFDNALRSAAGKDRVVLLLHDGVGYAETVRCLPRLIAHFRENGYLFQTL